MTKIRAFFAINLSIRVIEQLRGVQNDLRAKAKELAMKVAWVPPTNMHLTLKFLGQIAEENVVAIRHTLLPKFAEQQPISLKIKGTGAFPDRNRPKTLWAGVEDEQQGLGQLFEQLERWLVDLGFAPETRPFQAHLTLGRVKQGAADLLGEVADVDYGSCLVQEAMLYQSVLSPKGAVYTPLVRFPFAASKSPVAPIEHDPIQEQPTE